MSETPTVKPGDRFESCDPFYDRHPEWRVQIRVTEYTAGRPRATVVDAVTGKRPRSILVSSLHTTPLTSQGKPWRTGYRLVQDVEATDA